MADVSVSVWLVFSVVGTAIVLAFLSRRYLRRFQMIDAANVALAIQEQDANGVAVKYRGPWFHVSQNDNFTAFTADQEDWTWFTRSPLGGAIWGHTVVVAYIVGPLPDSRTHATGNKGDALGYENNKALPNWWLSVAREDIDRVVVVGKFHLVRDEAFARSLLDGDEYKVIRNTAIAAVM